MADPLSTTYDFTNGETADGSQVTQNFDDIEGYINNRLGNLTNGQLLIANASGQVVGRVISGDITIDNLGVATIGNDKITSDMIQADAVGSSEIVAEAVGSSEIGTLPYCELTHSVNQNVPDTGSTALAFDTEVVDTANLHSAGNPTRVTIPITGAYLITAIVEYEDSFGAGTLATTQIRLDGSVLTVIQKHSLAEADQPTPNLAAMLKLSAGQYLEVVVSHGGTSDKLVRGGSEATRLSVAWVCPG